ncbi:MAG: rpoH [Francisellaceae bacterium]|nr:rpoH [Francisellaceae bacterium]
MTTNINTALKLFSNSLPIGSLEAYLQQVNAIPLLTLEEEQNLANRLHEKGDLKAAQHLVLSHLRYVVKVAKGYLGYGLPLADLIQEGTIGLMKAVKRFNPSHGVRLVSFAVHWIKAEMHEFIIKNWRIVKIATTKEQRKLFFNLRNAKKRLGWFSHAEVQSVAKDLGVRPEEVLRMEARLNNRDVNFDTPIDSDKDTPLLAPIDYLEDRNANPLKALENNNWTDFTNYHFKEAFQLLDERSQDILRKRWLEEEKITLQELAATHKISLERVRQLEKNAIEKLKSFLQSI